MEDKIYSIKQNKQTRHNKNANKIKSDETK